MQVAYKLKEGMPFNLSTSNEIAVANGKDIYFHNTLSGKAGNDQAIDILEIMKLRIKEGYDLDIIKNAELSKAFKDIGLGDLWNYFALAYSLVLEEKKPEHMNPLQGFMPLFSRSRGIQVEKIQRGYIQVYQDEIREYLLECCGLGKAIGPNTFLSVNNHSQL